MRVKKPKRVDYDLVVLGGGSGAGPAAHTFAAAGKRVVIVEQEMIGGECPNYGCVPTKSLLQAAEAFKVAHEGKQFGIYADVRADYPKVKAWKDLAVHRTGTFQGVEVYAQEGIKVIKGAGKFIDPWTIEVNNKLITAHHFLIATGTRSIVPPIPGLKEAGFMFYREAIDLTEPPKSLFIIGGGAIGCEFAELFHTFGTKVHIADFTPHLLPLEDPEGGQLLQEVFATKGITVHTGTRVQKVSVNSGKKVVHYQDATGSHTVSVDEIFVSAGKAPNTDLGLEQAGVAFAKQGVLTDTHMQTSAAHIYAAGDVVGPYRFTHTATYQSRLAGNNMLHPRKKIAAEYHAIPRCVFVDPEIASVGLNELQLQEKKVSYVTGLASVEILGRANTSNVHQGFVKVIVGTKKGTILGATAACPRAGEVIHELTLAAQHQLTAEHIVNTVHAYPTWSEAVRHACRKALQQL